MPHVTLRRLPLELDLAAPLPPALCRFLDAGMELTRDFIDSRGSDPIPAFVPSDYHIVLQALIQLERRGLAHGSFCEWGCGLGIIAGAASLIGFDACGIEIDPDLVGAGRMFLDRHEIDIPIVRGSLVPEGFEHDEESTEIGFVTVMDGRSAYDELGLEPDDFDLIFAYPWPGEEGLIRRVFDRSAARGALLLCYAGEDGVDLFRKIR